MKKTSALIYITALVLAATLTLSGCAVQNDNSSDPLAPHKAELIDEISDEEANSEIAAVTVSSAVSDTETSSVTAPFSSSADPFENIGNDADLCFGYTYEGEFEPIDYEEYISEVYVEYSMKPYTGEKFSQYGMFIEVYYFNDDKDENYDNSAAAKRGFEFFAEKLSENGIVPVDGRKHEIIEVHIYKQGDILYVTAIFEETNGSEPIFFLEDEPVSLYGEDYVLISDRAVPADTKSLYIFSESMEFAKKYYGYKENSGENEAAVFDYSYTSDDNAVTVDLNEIAEKLPDLEKLYISHRINITSFEGLKKYGSFSELDISERHITEENADSLAGLSNIKKLCLRNVREKEDIEWTANAKFSELALECDYPKENMLKFVYSMPKVTELSIYGLVPDLTGIEAMTNLKKLNIVSGSFDGKQIDELKKAMPQCEIAYSPDEKSLATVYIGDVRIETNDGDDYWNKVLYVKNCGEKPVENLPEFLLQNGFTDGCEEMYISYPEHDGIEYSQVTERLQITDKGIDYDNFEMYLSVLSVPDEDYTDNFRYRTIVPDCEVSVLLHLTS